jgi:hypothetical protein
MDGGQFRIARNIFAIVVAAIVLSYCEDVAFFGLARAKSAPNNTELPVKLSYPVDAGREAVFVPNLAHEVHATPTYR